MRSGTCTNLKFSTNADVPFLIYAVMLSLRFINEKLNQNTEVVFIFFVRWQKLI
jgi:hypothetical protein